MNEHRYRYTQNVPIVWRDAEPDWRDAELDEARRAMERMDKDVGELRAVTAPLLDAPFRYETGPAGETSDVGECVFCGRRDTDVHTPDCPVLRKNALLGRA